MRLFAGGSQILSCGNDGRVLLSNLSNGAELRSFRVVASAPQAASNGSTSPPPLQDLKPTAIAGRVDNQRIAAGAQTGDVFVWNAGSGDTPLQQFKLDAPVTALAYSPDNQKLAVATSASMVHVFGPSLPNVQPRLELTLHQTFATESVINDLVFSSNNHSLWTASINGKVDQWNYVGLEQVRQMNHGGPVYGVAVSGKGNTVVSCSADQTVRVWDNSTGGQKFQLNGHVGPVHAIAMSRDETFAVSSGADGTLRLWDIVGGRQLKQVAKFEQTMYSVAIHPSGQLVAAAGADRRVHLLDIITGEERKTLDGHTDYIHCVAFDTAGDRLISYGYAGHLKIWNTASGALMHQSRIGKVGNYVQFSPDGTKILLSSGDGTASVIPTP
jgi:WD40 repeat protein